MKSPARTVKCINKSTGCRRFRFKKFSQRIKEIDTDVYQSSSSKAEPSNGSSFFHDCLIECRELNTAEDFISFYEEFFPLVQTLPQIILQKGLIISSLLSRLKMEARLSLEPILRLISALSKDLLEDFIPFLSRIVHSLESLLESGADRDPEIIKEIFTSWSYLMMHLQKYLIKDADYILSITANLRYYSQDYVREHMAQAVSVLLRKAPIQQLEKGIAKLMTEVVEEPSEMRKSGVAVLLFHIMTITPIKLHSLKLHSRTETLMPHLVDETSFQIGGERVEDILFVPASGPVLEVLISTFERLHAELDPVDFSFIWKCLVEKITESLTNENSTHLTRLLTLLISIARNDCIGEITDLVNLVGQLVETYVIQCPTTKSVDLHSEVIEKVLQLMLCIIDGFSSSNNMPDLGQWEPVFDIRSRSLLNFIGDLLTKDPSIYHVFGTNIMRALSNLIEISVEEVLYLMMKFCDNLEAESSSFWDGEFKKNFSLIFDFFKRTLRTWMEEISNSVEGNLFPAQKNTLAVLWAVIRCYSYLPDDQANPSLLLEFINAIDKLLMVESKLAGSQQNTWHSLIGAALRSYNKLVSRRSIAHEESAIRKFLDLADRYKFSPHILSAVADILDSVSVVSHGKCQFYLLKCTSGKPFDALDTFSENLSHANREIRLSALRIMCHYEPIHVKDSVLNLLRSIEETTLSIAESRKVILLITKLETSLSAHGVAEKYIHPALNGIFGILHNRLSYLWNPALECLTVLIGQYFGVVWTRYIYYLEQCQSDFLESHHQHNRVDTDSTEDTGKEWKGVLKEWLCLFRLLRIPRDLRDSKQGRFLRDVLVDRLLDQNDADLQTKVLDCLLNWKDEFLLPYSENLKNLINAKNLRDELARWSLSTSSIDSVDERHRAYLVPVVIQILIPKNASARHRLAVLRFLAELDLEELPVFFKLLVKPILTVSQSGAEFRKLLWESSKSPEFEVEASDILKHLTSKTIETLSWKKKYGFLHVVEDIFAVFDESRLNPFLNLLMNCVVLISASCTSVLGSEKSESFSVDNSSILDLEVCDNDEVNDKTKERKQLRDLRSLCLKVIYIVLNKYGNHDFGDAFWDMFFTSVKPLVAKLKKEGLGSQKPSSLFYCILAMSKSYKLVPLLSKEENLVPDIFSMLSVPSASNSILSCILKFAKNLLKFDVAPGSEDVTVKSVILPHLEKLMCGLHCIFTKENATKRPLLKFLGKREITIFNLLSKYVKEPSTAESFVDILLPYLTKKNQNFDTCVHALQIIRQVVTVVGNGKSKKILNSISPLLTSADLAVRNSIIDVLDAVASNDSSLLTMAKILRELNATCAMEMSGLDYDKIFSAYEKVNVNFFYTIEGEHALPILAHAVHEMSSEEMILRQSAFRLLLSFIEFSVEILNGSPESDQICSRASIQSTVNNFLLKHMGNAMNNEDAVKKVSEFLLSLFYFYFSGSSVGTMDLIRTVWIDLLREMVLKLPKEANLHSYRALCSDDAEQDFFNNIINLQKHRRARALSRFSKIVSSGNLSKVITYKVFVPMLFRMLFDAQGGKDEHIRSACIDALASISGCMNWSQYYAMLVRCFHDLALKPDRQKLLSRLICAILDHFHFVESSLINAAKVSALVAPDPYTIGVSTLTRDNSGEFPVIQESLHKKLFPKIQKLLISDSDNVNVNIILVALKLLKLLPSNIMDSQLPTVVHRISKFLKNRLESVRDEARSALFVCLKELGLEYLQFVVKVLKGMLRRGYELHVLGYTVNFLLSKLVTSPMCGKLDYCLNDLSVVVMDILGDVSEEKEVEKIASKMKETRKQKSYETLKVLAQNVTFKTHALKLLSLVTDHLDHKQQLTPKLKLKLEKMLNHIADGIVCNPSVQQTELLMFAYELIKDGIGDEGNEHANRSIPQADKRGESDQTFGTNRTVNVGQQFSHLITAFALRVLHNYMKRLKLNPKDGQLSPLLQHSVSLLVQCLSSKYDNVMIAAFRCLSVVVRLPFRFPQQDADKIKDSLLELAGCSGDATKSQLTESCMKLLTVLLRSKKITLSTVQLQMVIRFPLFGDFSKSTSFIALSLLKAIIQRKLKVPEIDGLVKIVAELMVQSHDEPIRKKCREILLQFLLTSQECFQKYLELFESNLGYEYPTGTESVVEMLQDIILKYPQDVVEAHSIPLFLHLVILLANGNERKVRAMSATAIKCLIGHVSCHPLQLILEYSLFWYLGGSQSKLWVYAQSFRTHLSKVLPVMRNILHSAVNAVTSSQQELSGSEDAVPFWKEAYYSLVMLEKILSQFHNMFLDRELEDIWDTICEFLLHPHLWLQTISCRITSSYFAAVTSACKKKENMDVSSFWSSLDHAEQGRFRKAFGILDPRKGKRTLESFISGASAEHDKHQHPFISYLLQRVGKITFQMEADQMKIVFNCYKSVAPKLLGCYGTPSLTVEHDVHSFAYQLLLPLYRVCEGHTGQVVSDDLKQSAQEASESIRDMIGVQNFVQVYSQICRNLKAKRDKRKQREKITAVVNPTRNAKRKLRIAAKHRVNKKRKIMTMKMNRWMH
ncbi:hypothetical protein C2S51_025175 [Perilla frutescens var. frutescens]|nr:hypothetical protein C2S51_025175 [Perilla frutescens var. frutescens]